MTKRRFILLVGLVLAMGVLLAACSSQAPSATPCPTCPTAAPVPTAAPAPVCPTAAACPKPADVPNQAEWAKSGHANAKAEAFVHWDSANPKVVPAACSQCHTPTGAQEYQATGKNTKDQPTGSTLVCATCHNSAADALTKVTFPSGITISGLGAEARCMSCHDGRASKKTIDDLIAKFKAEDADKVVEPVKNADGTTSNFSLQTAHYFTAALSLYGTEVKGGYEYAGKEYDAKNQHVAGYDTCANCHNPHSLEVEVAACAKCHTNVKAVADLKNIRMVSSVHDFNGNGDVKEGISAEVSGVQAVLLKAITAYAKDVAGVGIAFDNATYPYWFQDKDGDGKADKDDKGAAISFTKVTPRLLKAAYNYVVVAKDPGIYAHNPKYAIELMYDSIADLNTKLATKIDVSKMSREDAGHFAGAGMPFRDWDAEGEVPYSCAKCHSSAGLPEFIKNGGTIAITKAGSLYTTGVGAQEPANGFLCSTCHDPAKPYAANSVYPVVNVPFPNEKTLTFSTKKDDKGALITSTANICIECHQGRQSTLTMNNFLATLKESQPDKVDATISFKNVHYFSAGATLFGSDAQGIYQYAGKTYNGRNMHTAGFETCTECHDKHSLDVKQATCAGCHKDAAGGVEKIRMSKDDFDGSKDAAKPMKAVLDTFEARLLAAIQKYAKETAKVGIVYDAGSNPYFFLDKDGDGKADKDDKGALLRYNAFTPRLLQAAYNYQYSQKDPGAFAHNPKYVLQALYDSIEDLKGDLTGLTRPAAPAK